MDKLLQYIPGFRSNKTWKKIIATLYYAMSLLTLSEGWGISLFMLAMPFLVCSFIDILQHNKKNIPLKKAFIPFVLSFALVITGVAATGPSKSELALNEQKEAEEQAKIEAEERAKQEELKKQEEEERARQEEIKRQEEEEKKRKQEEAKKVEEEESKKKSNVSVAGQLKVHYLDVGQGDSTLIHTKDAAMLIDAGDRGYGSGIVDYIKEQDIDKLDYLILTHPHADHIGGAVEVINAFDIDKIIMPKASHTSQTFENLLATIKDKGMKIASPNPGDEYELGDAKFTILGPNSSSYDNLNNYSVVNKLTFGHTSFLFTGDAEVVSENEILNSGLDIKTDVLKVGHHGSDTSTSEQFLDVSSPKCAIISVGKDNKYGHPDQVILDRLDNRNITIYRTDESGTIIATSDGENVSFDKGASPIKQNAPPKQETKSEPKAETKPAPKQETKPAPKQEAKPAPKPETDNVEEVYITNTGKKYHRGTCGSLHSSKIPISLEKAKNQGYEPCKRCHPPQ